MAKRFSEVEKWQDEWFTALEPIEKLVWLFLCDKCDNAGFFEINARVNSFLIGIKITEYLGAIEALDRGLVKSKDGKKGFIKNFLWHQKNLPLNPSNNAHRQILALIDNVRSEFLYDFDKNLGAKQGLNSPIGTGIGNGTGNGKGKTPEILENFEHWIKHNAEQVKTLQTKTKKTENQIIAAAADYHLYLIQKGEYPKAAEMLLAGFERRLVNNWGAKSDPIEIEPESYAAKRIKELLTQKQAQA